MNEIRNAQERHSYAPENEYISARTLAYSFIWCFSWLGISVVLLVFGVSPAYCWLVLLAGFIPMALVTGYDWFCRTFIKPHKVGKYVLENKQLPEDLKPDNE